MAGFEVTPEGLNSLTMTPGLSLISSSRGETYAIQCVKLNSSSPELKIAGVEKDNVTLNGSMSIVQGQPSRTPNAICTMRRNHCPGSARAPATSILIAGHKRNRNRGTAHLDPVTDLDHGPA